MPVLHSFHRTVTNTEFYYIILTANLGLTSAARRPRTLAWPHFILVPSEQRVCSSRMSRSKVWVCGRSSIKGKWAQKLRGTSLSPSEKVPQNPKENHHLLLLLLLVARSIEIEKRLVRALSTYVTLIFQIWFTSLRLTKVTMQSFWNYLCWALLQQSTSPLLCGLQHDAAHGQTLLPLFQKKAV